LIRHEVERAMSPAELASLAEVEVADRARCGDREALVLLYRRHSEGLFRHAFRMLGDEAGARDAVQEAFARAIVALPRTRADEGLRFRAWMLRIVTNLCLKELTRRSRVRVELSEILETREGEPATPAGGPEEARGERERGTLVGRALEAIPPRYRQILLLREVEELSYEEIATLLGTSLASVKITLHRARARLSAVLLAERLLAAPAAAAERCRALGALIASEPEAAKRRRRVERHLLECEACRDERSPAAAELLAALAPLPPFDPSSILPPVTPAASGATGTGAGASTGGLSGGLLLAGGVAAAAVFAAIATAISIGQGHDHGARPGPTARVAQSASSTAAGTPEGSAAPAPPVSAGKLDIPVKHAIASYSSKQSKLVNPASPSGAGAAPRRGDRAAGPPAAGGGVASARVPQAGDAELPGAAPAKPAAPAEAAPGQTRPEKPALKLLFRKGTVQLERKGLGRALSPGETLERGDRVVTTRGASLGVHLASAEWLTLSGLAELVSVPPASAPTEPLVLRLLSGSVRAKATGRPPEIRLLAAGQTITADRGELQLRLAPDGLRVEALSAYVTVRGPHPARVVPPRRSLHAGDGGITVEPLLEPPRGLRPTAHASRTPPLLEWSPVPRATGYLVVVGSEANFLCPEETAVVAVPRHRPRTTAVGKHFFRVSALRGAAEGSPSFIYAYDIAPSPRADDAIE
jgi:RNA polymerase sigma-70 factor, ECF subfamily